MKEIKDNDISVLKGKVCYILFYFTASWCRPCQKIKPLIEKISDGVDPKKLEIYKVDIDDNDELALELKVKSIPTFYLFKGKELQGQCGGADITQVQELLKTMK